MQPRVLLTALALVAVLIVSALMLLGDFEQAVPVELPGANPVTPAVASAVPLNVGNDPAPEISRQTPLDGQGIITGRVIPLEGSPLPTELVVRLVRLKWPQRLAGQSHIDATTLVNAEAQFGVQDDIPLLKDLRGIVSEVRRLPCEQDGSFRFDGLGAGSYLVCAGGPDLLWSPASDRAILGDRRGWETECEVPLQPTRTVSVKVFAEGRAVADAWVGLRGEIVDRSALPESLYLPVEKIWLFLLNDPFVSALTAANGTATFSVLPSIPYLIFARKEGKGTGEAYSKLEDSRLQNVELIQGGTFSGVVMGFDGQPVAGAKIEMSYSGLINTEYFVPGAEGVSEEDGTFEFNDLKPGTYEVKVGQSGYQTRTMDDLIINPAQELYEEVLLLKGHRISGVVVDSLGEPLPGATIRLQPDRAPSVLTDSEGQFEFDTLEPRTYRVLVESACLIRSSTETEVDAEPLEIVVEEGWVVSGRFVDAEGAPIAGVKVQISDRARSDIRAELSSDLSAIDGTFSVCSEVLQNSEKPLVLFAFPPFHEKLVLDLQEGIKDLGDLVLAPASRIFGTTRAPDGTPLPGVILEIDSGERPDWDPTGRMNRRSFSDGQGQYEIYLPVSSRSWTLNAKHSDYAAANPVEIPPGESGRNIPMDVLLTKGANLEVVVTSAGQVVQGVTVELSKSRGWSFVRKVGVTDERGLCRFDGLSDLSLRVKATKSGFGSARMDVELLAADENRVEVSLDPAISFSGTVLCEGIPVAGAEISIRDVSSTSRQALTDSRGDFQVEALASGALRVDVRADGHLFRRIDGVDPRESPLTIAIEKTYNLTGYLFDGTSREPIVNALVRVTAVDESGQPRQRGGRRIRSRRSNEEGRFVTPNLPQGIYQVLITSTDHLPFEQILNVPTVPDPVEFALQRGERIYLQVTDENGLPLEGVRIRPEVRKDRQRNRGDWVSLPTPGGLETDSNGELSIGGLEEGLHSLRLQKNGYLEKRELIDVGISTRSEVQRYVLDRGGIITGVVYFADGEPASRRSLRCDGMNENGEEVTMSARTGRDGKYTIGALPSGNYTITVRNRRSSSESFQIRRLDNGAPVEVQIQAPQNVEIDLEILPQ